MSDTDLTVDMTLKVLNITNREAELDRPRQKSGKKKNKRTQSTNCDNVAVPEPTKKTEPNTVKLTSQHPLTR
ncbi:hypothetical protein ACUNB3_001941 [Vibrio alginolyticus]|nr:hypothetical protein [Vibrio alginolyticus]